MTPVWHAIKGQQKDTIKTKCSQCGKVIKIYPSEPKLCWECRVAPNQEGRLELEMSLTGKVVNVRRR